MRRLLPLIPAVVLATSCSVIPLGTQGPAEAPHAHARPRIPSAPVIQQPAPRSLPAGLPRPGYRLLQAAGTGQVEARLLLLAARPDDADLAAFRAALDRMGTPYDVWIASERPGQLTAEALRQGDVGRYQGIVLSEGWLSYFDGQRWRTALQDAEWQALWQYEQAFGVRQVSLDTYPEASFGFRDPHAQRWVSTQLPTLMSPAGQQVFPYLTTQAPLPLSQTYVFLAKPLAGATPLLLDRNGNALAVSYRTPDGRETLSFAFSQDPYGLHSLTLAYGAVYWVSQGLFLGERRVALSAQVDDVFLGTRTYKSGKSYRISGADLDKVAAWQAQKQAHPNWAGFKLDLAFNGPGDSVFFQPDTLTPAAKRLQGAFKWINHTDTHLNLDAADRATAFREVETNEGFAASLGLSTFDQRNLVTPQISGLQNAQALQGAYDAGVRFVVGDIYHPGLDNPSPNAGRYLPAFPGILMVPRIPNNLFWDVSTPAEWIKAYADLNGQSLTLGQILNAESDWLVRFLLEGNLDPWMFHQGSMRAYNGTNSLLAQLLDRTMARYDAWMALPVWSPTMDQLAEHFVERQLYDQGGVTARVQPGVSLTLSATRDTVVPVTGLASAGSEIYGGHPISRIRLQAGETRVLPLR